MSEKVSEAGDRVYRETTDAARSVTEEASKAGDRVYRQATDVARDMGDQASEAGDRIYRQAVAASKQVSRQVEEQPWLAALIAGGLGLVIGVMLGRGSVSEAPTARDRMDEYLPRNLRQR